MSALVQRIVLAMLTCLLSGAVRAEVSIDMMLNEADRIRTSEPDRFRRLLSDLDRAVEQASVEQKQRLEFLHAYQMVRMGDLPGAISKFKELKNKSTSIELRYRAGAMLANVYAATREFREGLVVAEEILQFSDEIKDRDSRHQGFIAVGILYNQVGEYQLGRRYADKVVADQPSARNRCIADNLRVESSIRIGKSIDDSDAVAALRQCEAIGDATLAGFSRTYVARIWHKSGRTREAIDLLESHLPEVQATGYPVLIGEVHALLAEMRLSIGNDTAAERHAQVVTALDTGLANSQALVVAYKILFEITERRGEIAPALALFKRYAAAERQYREDVAAREMAYQIVRHQSLQQTQQIELLNRQNEVLQLQQQVQEQNAQNTRLLVLLLLLLLASIAFWAYKTKRVQMSLRRMAETDALTGISNRHHFTQQSEQALVQCARAGEDVALVMFDLDHFKSINDRYGHDTGDWVLQRVVAICAPVCRQIDFFGRIGGEEFAILLIGIDARGAKRLAEDCRVRIAGIDSGGSGYRFKPTASFGVTTTALSGYDLAKMLSHADKMLYRAKHAGRNRVFVYEIPVPVQLPVPVGGAHDDPESDVALTAIEVAEDVPPGAGEDPPPQRRAAAVS